jgi:predicted nucleotidyltransferase
MGGRSRENPLLNPDFRDMLSVLCDEQVEFLLVGAYALAAHGLPRATGDMDIWIRCSDENAQRVWRALQRFGAPLFDLTASELQTPGLVFQIGVIPQRIDILTAIDGVLFDDAWTQRKTVEIEGLTIAVIGRAQLIQNKKAAGRPKDLADVAWLETTELE